MVDPIDEEAVLESEGISEDAPEDSKPEKYSKEELATAGGDDLEEVNIEDADEATEEEIESEIETEDEEGIKGADGEAGFLDGQSQSDAAEAGDKTADADQDQAEGDSDSDEELFGDEADDDVVGGKDDDDSVDEPAADIYGHQV